MPFRLEHITSMLWEAGAATFFGISQGEMNATGQGTNGLIFAGLGGVVELGMAAGRAGVDENLDVGHLLQVYTLSGIIMQQGMALATAGIETHNPTLMQVGAALVAGGITAMGLLEYSLATSDGPPKP